MLKIQFKLVVLLLLMMSDVFAGDVVVIGHSSLSKMDAKTIQKIFLGRLIEVGGLYVTAINLKPCALREHFLQDFLQQDDDKYTAYWMVRRYIGKGLPPRELANPAEVVAFVQTTPGAIGYIEEKDLKPGLNVIAR
ncbi:MAG: hypothetical protein PHU06_06450 [Gallionella sp.]|nr:hypothetical protein [Gallionella sp.]MDD4958152.1 hypothetical protein [Gallionella sp.]